MERKHAARCRYAVDMAMLALAHTPLVIISAVASVRVGATDDLPCVMPWAP
jgi:hypothetical protein